MKYGTPFIVNTDGKELKNNADSTMNDTQSFTWQKTNVWNSAFNSPEISCDFELLHNDLLEIKKLIAEISECIKNYFCTDTK